ncbi:peptidase [Acetobacter musti]|uniref:Peptidase n=1 Tax=Acetobacter musti TaxID=864732 RepID=A0ABX0JKI6_9PROT|nr:XRE family transcriptional regulator [Acetobacter musti]NHN83864.1 peptidase [Acetobacter musti]
MGRHPRPPLEAAPDDDNDTEVRKRSERLRVIVQAAGGNSRVAARANIPLGTLNNYIAGREMRVGPMIALADACDVSLDWLATGREKMDGNAVTATAMTSVAEEMRSIRYFHAEPQAGVGSMVDQWEGCEFVFFSDYFLRSVIGVWNNNVFMVRVSGDSMRPSIENGDTIFVDPTLETLREDVYVMTMQDMFIVKRLLIRSPESFTISSDNSAFRSFDVPSSSVAWAGSGVDADLKIIGRVLGRIHLGL